MEIQGIQNSQNNLGKEQYIMIHKIVTLSIPKLNTELRPEYANPCGTDIQRYSAWLTTFQGKRGVFFNKESG